MIEWIEFLMILLVLGCIISWVIIGIGILKYRMKKKCPAARICKDKECRWGDFCEKHRRFTDREKYLFEIAREYQKKMKSETKR